jgi:endonuclease-3
VRPAGDDALTARAVTTRGAEDRVTGRTAGRARRETKDALRKRAAAVTAALAADYPEADCALRHRNAFELLAATILSAQCTDVRVNMVTPELFRRWGDAPALAAARQEDVEEVIHSTGFFRNKAKNLLGMANALVERHGGEVPDTMDALTALPGVARKTANVVLGTWFGKAEGVVVDTHVGRIAGKLALSRETDPAKIEADLMDLLPRAEWTAFSHRVILHGRRICDARRPKCAACSLRELCPSREDLPPAAGASSKRRLKPTPKPTTKRGRTA